MKSYQAKFYMIVLSIPLFFLSAINIYAEQESRLALLIGNSNYQFSGKLNNPINDVRAIEKILKQLGFTVLKYEDCSQKTMKRAIDKFGRQLKTKDVGLFFYAGHGVQVDGYNYLLPINAKLENENDAEYDCVRAGRILAKMESAGSKTNIVILDACRANPFERAWRRGEKGSGLAFMNAPSGSLIAYSTAPGNTALDGRGKNSPYTRALLKHIDAPNITIIQMFQRVRAAVMKQSNKQQIPWESTSLRGDFYFKEGRRLKVMNKENEKPNIIKTNETRLFVDTEPKTAMVRILNIKPKFHQGIELNPGHYHIEVSHNGYKTKKMWSKLNIDEQKSLYIQLEPIEKQAYTQPKTKEKLSANIENVNKLLNRGKLSLEKKQYTRAIQDFTQVIDLDPNQKEVYYLRGIAYIPLKQYTRAIQDLTQAIDLDPSQKDGYFLRGFAYYRLKQYTKAIQGFTQAIDLDPNLAPAYNRRAFTYYLLSDFYSACSDAKKACDLGECFLWRDLNEHNMCN